jgi:2-polyprenyl-3-methyl-5-hydroxy-6-metoxy-1,4-benzoquinol methylase
MKIADLRNLFKRDDVSQSPAALDDQAGHVRNIGKVSFTYQDSGLYGKYINRERLKAWRHGIEHYQIDSGEILDVGCAYGSWASNWKELGFRTLIGIDPNEDVIERAEALFDEVHCGFADKFAGVLEPRACVAANGVIVHILEDESELAFLKSMRNLCTGNGRVCFGVINCEFYPTKGGRAPWTGPNSATRRLVLHRELAARAGLTILAEIGTFINPWALKEFDLTMKPEHKESARLYDGWSAIAEEIRAETITPFSEVLFVTQPNDDA